MTSPRVLWLTKGLGLGGAEMLLVSLARAMTDAPLHIEVGYVLPHKDTLAAELATVTNGVHCLGDRRPRPWTIELSRLLARGHFDIVHTHAPVIASAARMLAPSHAHVVHTEHNVWSRYRSATRLANAATLGRNRMVFAVSESVARSIRPWGPASWTPPVRVLLHGVDPSRVQVGAAARAEGRRRLDLSDGAPVIGAVGNLTPKKDHATLLRAFALVRDLVPGARLVLIGSGKLDGTLKTLARELRLGSAVTFAGRRDDVPHLLPAFDLFVMSSRYEGLSIALVEAMSAGVPVVATRVGGIPEVVQDGVSGLLVPPSRPEILARTMSRVLLDARLQERLVSAGFDRGKEFGIQRAADELSRYYQAVHAGADTVAAS